MGDETADVPVQTGGNGHNADKMKDNSRSVIQGLKPRFLRVGSTVNVKQRS